MTTELTPARAAGPNTRAARRSAAPRLDPALAHLSLPSVRAYRHMLAQEEFAATSWRRLISVHLAALAGAAPACAAVSVGPVQLRDPARDPSLEPADNAPGSAWVEWIRQLHDLDHELAGYRESAVERLARVTDELIARYHQDPSRCLAALPLHRAPPRH